MGRPMPDDWWPEHLVVDAKHGRGQLGVLLGPEQREEIRSNCPKLWATLIGLRAAVWQGMYGG